MKMTAQEKFWSADFGKEYNRRNRFTPEGTDRYYEENFGVTKSEMNSQFIGRLRLEKVLEAGCNVGVQLAHLKKTAKIGEFFGIDIQQDAVEKARKNVPFANVVKGSLLDIPFKDGFFDMVFTCGVLIHIAPKDLLSAMAEIVRCSKKYVWGFEYYSQKASEIEYRGHKGYLWKNDFARLYLDNFPELSLVKEKRFRYVKSDNEDTMFLLKKKN